MQEVPKNLNSLIFHQTQQFEKTFIQEYTPAFQQYKLNTYNRLIDCYKNNIKEEDFVEPNSNRMIAYYDCYKSIMREGRAQNKKLYEQSLENDKKLKHCLEIKSNFSKGTAQFQEEKEECLNTYKQRYHDLYKEVLMGIPRSTNKQQKTNQQLKPLPKDQE